MTPDELRSLADEAMATPSVDETPDEYRARWEQIDKLHALAPDLALLVAELGEALAETAILLQYLVLNNIPLDEMHTQARDVRGEVEVALARLSELTVDGKP